MANTIPINVLATHEDVSCDRISEEYVLTEKAAEIQSDGILIDGIKIIGNPKELVGKWVLMVKFPKNLRYPEEPKGAYAHTTVPTGGAKIWGAVKDGPFYSDVILTLDAEDMLKRKYVLSTLDDENSLRLVEIAPADNLLKVSNGKYSYSFLRLDGFVLHPSGHTDRAKLDINFRCGCIYIKFNGRDVPWIPSDTDSKNFLSQILDPSNNVVLIQPSCMTEDWKKLDQLGTNSGIFFFSRKDHPSEVVFNVFNKTLICEDIWHSCALRPVFRDMI